ncbi:MAG: PadR family transcriptional regulator [Vicinamibacterales bacterium]
MRTRLGYATAAIFRAVAGGSRFGLDIMRDTGLPSGTVYPTLTRAEASGLVRGRWESRRDADAAARPRRRYYELTDAGAAALDEALARFGQLAATTRRTRGRS